MAFTHSSVTVWLSAFAFLTTLLATFTTAQNSTFPSSTFIYSANADTNFTVSVNVPAKADNGDLYFRLVAPASLGWYAFGFGAEMAGSLSFIVYPSGDGKNVTVSPRLGTGHVMPGYTGNVQVTVLAGSGMITDQDGGEMVVNARCQGCRKWNGGIVDVTARKQPMIYAVGPPGPPIHSDSKTFAIHQHVANGQFTMDMVAATGAGGVPSNTSTQTGVTQLTNDGGAGGEAGPAGALHGLFMCATFIVLFPGGYLFLRLFERMWIHIAFQSFGLFIFLLGSTSGIVLSIRQNKNPNLNSAHQAIGLIVLLGVLTQWSLGMAHHCIWKRKQAPTLFGKIHRFVGPAVIGVGLLNGVLGFNFAGMNFAIIGYIIVVLLMVVFVTTLLFFKRRRQHRKDAMNSVAAQNFRQGNMEPQYAGVQAADSVPLQRVPFDREFSTGPPQYGEAQQYANAPPTEVPGNGNQNRL